MEPSLCCPARSPTTNNVIPSPTFLIWNSICLARFLYAIYGASLAKNFLEVLGGTTTDANSSLPPPLPAYAATTQFQCAQCVLQATQLQETVNHYMHYECEILGITGISETLLNQFMIIQFTSIQVILIIKNSELFRQDSWRAAYSMSR